MAEKGRETGIGEIGIGARGWLHPGWAGVFYPEDLPPDWRLAYYANEFDRVVIREQEWQQAGDMAALREEVPAHFRFVAELPPPAEETDPAIYMEGIRQLGGQCDGVIIPAGQPLAAYRAWLPASLTCYCDEAREGGGRLIRLARGTSLKGLREALESALELAAEPARAVPSAAPVLMMVEGEPPDIELLRNALSMYELF